MTDNIFFERHWLTLKLYKYVYLPFNRWNRPLQKVNKFFEYHSDKITFLISTKKVTFVVQKVGSTKHFDAQTSLLRIRDVCAAAITSSSLYELVLFVSHKREFCIKSAEKLLKA